MILPLEPDCNHDMKHNTWKDDGSLVGAWSGVAWRGVAWRGRGRKRGHRGVGGGGGETGARVREQDDSSWPRQAQPRSSLVGSSDFDFPLAAASFAAPTAAQRGVRCTRRARASGMNLVRGKGAWACWSKVKKSFTEWRIGALIPVPPAC